MTTVKRQVLALVAAAAFTSAAHATIEFNVGGLAGTGVTANVKFTYTSAPSGTAATLKFVIENTTDYSSSATVGSRISAFGFNIPSIGGTTFASIADVTDLDPAGPKELALPPSSAIPENSASNQAGWYGWWDFDDIKTPNNAGYFDFGVMNADNPSSFITDGQGLHPAIYNNDDSNDFTTFTLNVTGTGLNALGIEQDFMSAFSVPKQGSQGSYNFGVRFQGIGTNDDSDFAVVPTPGAAALAAFGLGIVGWVNRRRTL